MGDRRMIPTLLVRPVCGQGQMERDEVFGLDAATVGRPFHVKREAGRAPRRRRGSSSVSPWSWRLLSVAQRG